MKWGVLVVLGGIGLVLLGFGTRLGLLRLQTVRQGWIFHGTVVGLHDDPGGRDPPRPVVEYVGRDGTRARFLDRYPVDEGTLGSDGQRHRKLDLGSNVEVVCEPGKPATAEVRTWRFEASPALLAGIGLALLLMGLGFHAFEANRALLGQLAHALLLLLVGGSAWGYVLWRPLAPAPALWVLRAVGALLVAVGAGLLIRAVLPGTPGPSATPGGALTLLSPRGKGALLTICGGAWMAGTMGPIAAAFLSSPEPEWLPIVALLGFSVLGAAAVGKGLWDQATEWWQGPSTLALDRSAIAEGEEFSLEWSRSGRAHAIEGGMAVVRCTDWFRRTVFYDSTETSGGRSRTVRKSREERFGVAVWEESQPFAVRAGASRMSLRARIPAGLPATPPPPGTSVRLEGREWTVVLSGSTPGPDYRAEFLLPVLGATGRAGQEPDDPYAGAKKKSIATMA